MTNTIVSANALTSSFLTTSVTQTDDETDGVSSGVAGQSGQTPGADSPTYSFDEMLQSLQALCPQSTSAGDVEALAAAVQQEMSQTETDSSQASVKNNSAIREAWIEKQKEALQEAADKLASASDKDGKTSILDKVKEAFQLLAAAVSTIVGVALCCLGAVPLGAMMVVSGALGLVMGVNSAVQEATGLGIAGNIAKANGDSTDQIAKADKAFGIAMITAVVVAAVAGFAFGALSDVADLAEDAQMIATGAKAIGSAVNGWSALETGILSIATASIQYQASNDRADADHAQANYKRAQVTIDQLQAFIDTMIQSMTALFKSSNAALSEISQAAAANTQALLQAKI